MNKKIISAAIAATFAVSGVAMADATISGHIEQTFMTDGANGTDVSGSDDNFVVISASEDLGNGMSAFGKIRMDLDNNGATAEGTTTDSIVGLKGDFGTFMTGRAEAFVESKLMATMSFDGHTVIEDSLTTTPNTGRLDNMVAYVSPDFNGLSVGVGGYADVATLTSDDIDATEIAVFYNNGPLALQAAFQDVQSGTETLAVSGSYTMDALKATILYVDSETNAGADATDLAYRVDYTMGNNVIRAAYLDDEVTATGAEGDDVFSLELVHNFSKRTSAYIGTVNPDTADDYQYVGLQHNF